MFQVQATPKMVGGRRNTSGRKATVSMMFIINTEAQGGLMDQVGLMESEIVELLNSLNKKAIN